MFQLKRLLHFAPTRHLHSPPIHLLYRPPPTHSMPIRRGLVTTPKELDNEPLVDQSKPQKENSSMDNDPKVDTVTESRVFHPENNSVEMMKIHEEIRSDIGNIKADLGTIKWQFRALLTAVIGGGGSLLAYCVHNSLFTAAKEEKAKGGEGAGEVLELLRELIEKTESPKPRGGWW